MLKIDLVFNFVNWLFCCGVKFSNKFSVSLQSQLLGSLFVINELHY